MYAKLLKNTVVAVFLGAVLLSSQAYASGALAKAILRGLKEGPKVLEEALVVMGVKGSAAGDLATSIVNGARVQLDGKSLPSVADAAFVRSLSDGGTNQRLLKLLNTEKAGDGEAIELNNRLFKAAERKGISFGRMCAACKIGAVARELDRSDIDGLIVDLPPWAKGISTRMPSTVKDLKGEIELLAKKPLFKDLSPMTALDNNAKPDELADVLLFLRLAESSDADARRFYKNYVDYVTVKGQGTKLFGHDPSKRSTMWRIALTDLDKENEAAARETLNKWSNFYERVAKDAPDGEPRAEYVVQQFQVLICNDLDNGGKTLKTHGKNLQDNGCYDKIFSELMTTIDCDDLRQSGLLAKKR
ncbi:MAG: hypothetical protein ISR65_11725 [Bacteriovoracaceae bacterium]|nr:hypothetical protein [Bacteriovoracaceae bacterium]